MKAELRKQFADEYRIAISDCKFILEYHSKDYAEWLEQKYATQSPEPNKELRNIVSDAMDALAMDIAATKEVDVSIHVDALTRKLEPNTVTEKENFKKYLYDKFMKVLPDLAFKEILSEGYADDIIEWLQQTQAVGVSVTGEQILDEILLESNKTPYYHNGSPIYMARLLGFKKASMAIKELLNQKK